MNIETTILIIIIANVIISLLGFNNLDFFNKYKFQIGKIQHGKEYIRLISSGFLHADFMHLILNMYVLYSFAPIVSYALGGLMFAMVYTGSLIAGGLLTLFFHKKNHYYSAVGASGAVAGIIFSSILLFPEMKVGILFIPVGIPGYVFGLLYILYSIYGMKSEMGNIGHAAHLGGAIGGYVLTILLYPVVLENNLSTILLLGIPIVLLFVLGKMKVT
jgi:membrane associated rhomboid family serine protease